MVWQKWLIRALILALTAAVVAGGGLYALWTKPAAIRLLVQEKLGVRFVDVGVEVGSARLRLLGGILVRELRLARSNALERQDFLYVPSAVIYHDKEKLFSGAVAIRRVELTRPHLRLVREHDGRINVAGILGPVDLNERMPTMVIRDGVIVLEDRSKSASPILEIKNVQLSMINDPLPTLQLEGSGHSDVLGPIRFRASVPRATLAAEVELDLSAVPIADLARRAIDVCPALALAGIQVGGLARVSMKLRMPDQPGANPTYDVDLHLGGGHFAHPFLPRPLEKIELSTRLTDGIVPEARVKAVSGRATLEGRVAGLRLPDKKPNLAALLGLARELDLSVAHLDVDDDVLARLPPELHFIKEDFSPAGPVSVRFRYRGAGTKAPCQEWTFQPEGMTGSFIDFPYPVREVRGTIWLDTSAIPRRNIRIALTGRAGEQPVTLEGTVKGEKKTSEVILDITGKNVLLDDRLMRALKARVQTVARQFLPQKSRTLGLELYPMGRGDFDVAVRRDHGQSELQKRFAITFRNAAVQYDQFPYPLEDVCGVLVLHPHHWEARGFRGRHSGGEMFFEGRSYPVRGSPNGTPTSERVQIRIRGKDILLDKEFETALVPANGQERRSLQAAWRQLRLAGRLSFDAEVTDHPGQPQDIDVAADVQGCSIQPAFFDYALHQLSGSVRYAHGRLTLRDMQARHGKACLGLTSGLIQLGAEGGFTAWLEGLTGRDLTVDSELLHALPETLRHALEGLRFRSPLDIATKLTMVSPPGPSRPLEVWWEGAAGLKQATLRTGIELTEATGQLYCKGYHDGRRLRTATGQVRLDTASVVGQPLTNLFARLDVEPSSPDVVRVRDLRADLFGGTIAGQARLETAPLLKYDVLLEAVAVQLEQLGRHNLGDSRTPTGGPRPAIEAQLQGPARASLHLTGEGGDLTSLKGNGRIDVPHGKMGQLPVLLDLVKAFGLRVPDRTAFEQAQMVFAVEGPQLLVQQLDLYGNAISLRGQGSLDLDGSNLNLDFSATPGRMTQILPAGFDLIPQAISGQLLKIKMRGKLGKGGEMKFDKELIPGVVEPLRRVIGGGG